jgi:hypothetical protein
VASKIIKNDVSWPKQPQNEAIAKPPNDLISLTSKPQQNFSFIEKKFNDTKALEIFCKTS